MKEIVPVIIGCVLIILGLPWLILGFGYYVNLVAHTLFVFN